MKPKNISAQLNSNLIFKLPINAAIFIPVAAIIIAGTSAILAYQWHQLPLNRDDLEPGKRRETLTNFNPLKTFPPTKLSFRVML